MSRRTGLMALAAVLFALHFDGQLDTQVYVALGVLVVVAMIVTRSAHPLASTVGKARAGPARWLIVSGQHMAEAVATDPWQAVDALRDRPLGDFGLMIVALPFGGGRAETIRTSLVMGQRWGRVRDAQTMIERAIRAGLPDTSTEDLRHVA